MTTIQQIASRVKDNLYEYELDALCQMDRGDLRSLNSTLGRDIRNDYGLLHDSDLTKGWRDDPEGRFIIDGVDHSDDHPDAVSAKIILELWRDANASI